MAASFNKVIMVGTLVRDPEIRYIASGAGVTKFRIAVNPNKRDAKPEDTLFIDVVAWDKLAETCNTYLKKGMSALVEGRLSIRQYDDKDGNKRQATEVVINTMQMLGSRGDRENSAGGGDDWSAKSAVPAGGASAHEDALDEEIPF
ncbi:MAG: single-stranded DNA-binding protein [Candidatus Eremiobacteraeota bacterium]|nr:single-stranded DNA-binding protein [Candidatus Eremiobacteraeota bacterium]